MQGAPPVVTLILHPVPPAVSMPSAMPSKMAPLPATLPFIHTLHKTTQLPVTHSAARPQQTMQASLLSVTGGDLDQVTTGLCRGQQGLRAHQLAIAQRSLEVLAGVSKIISQYSLQGHSTTVKRLLLQLQPLLLRCAPPTEAMLAGQAKPISPYHQRHSRPYPPHPMQLSPMVSLAKHSSSKPQQPGEV